MSYLYGFDADGQGYSGYMSYAEIATAVRCGWHLFSPLPHRWPPRPFSRTI